MTAFQKGRGTNEPRAKFVGNSRTGQARRNNGGQMTRRRATKPRGTNVVPQTNVLPIKDERAEAQEFSAVILDFSAGHLATAAKRTKEAAKKWKTGETLPSVWSVMNMAQTIPAVRDWAMRKLGGRMPIHPESHQALNAVAQAIQIVAAMPGPDGERLRKILAGEPDG